MINDKRILLAVFAYITDSGKGAIIVVDLFSGKARRLLDDHKSTKPEPGVKLTVDGRELIDQQEKTPPQIASDGIALDTKNGYLYYHALTGHTLYRIKTSYLIRRETFQERSRIEDRDRRANARARRHARRTGREHLPDGLGT
jgi:hypothetical protein